jgi:hypothetical protein
MKALLVIALLAGAAHTESNDMLLRALERAMDRQETSCAVHLAELQRRGVPMTQTIRTKYGSRYLRRGVHALQAVRVACDAMRIAAVQRAVRDAHDPATRAACVRMWNEAKANGLFDHRLATAVSTACE